MSITIHAEASISKIRNLPDQVPVVILMLDLKRRDTSINSKEVVCCRCTLPREAFKTSNAFSEAGKAELIKKFRGQEFEYFSFEDFEFEVRPPGTIYRDFVFEGFENHCAEVYYRMSLLSRNGLLKEPPYIMFNYFTEYMHAFVHRILATPGEVACGQWELSVRLKLQDSVDRLSSKMKDLERIAQLFDLEYEPEFDATKYENFYSFRPNAELERKNNRSTLSVSHLH